MPVTKPKRAITRPGLGRPYDDRAGGFDSNLDPDVWAQLNATFTEHLSYQGVYSAGTEYQLNDVVKDGSGNLYRYIFATPATGQALSNATYWQLWVSISSGINNLGWFNVKDDAYKASGSSQTTTGSITTGTNSLTVASAIDFAVGQGIYIAGAGASGTNLITTISAISGTTITLAVNAGATVSGAVVQHDDTKAIQDAIDAAYTAGGGTIYIPRGFYRCNRALQSAGTHNSVLTIPNRSPASPRFIRIVGDGAPQSGYDNARGESGTVLQTNVVGSGSNPAFVSGKLIANITANTSWSYVQVYMEDIEFRLYDNPTLHGLQFGNNVGVSLTRVAVTTGVSPGSATNPTGGTKGIIMPQTGNYGLSYLSQTYITGFDTLYDVSEHTIFDYVAGESCKVGVDFRAGYHISEGNLNLFQCITPVKFSGRHPVRLTVDLERATSGWWAYTEGTTKEIDDASNHATGEIAYSITVQNTGHTTADIATNGAKNVTLKNLSYPVAPPIALTFTANGDGYFVADQNYSLREALVDGTGTLAYQKKPSGGSFGSVSLPISLAKGDVLKVTVSSISGYKAVTLR